MPAKKAVRESPDNPADAARKQPKYTIPDAFDLVTVSQTESSEDEQIDQEAQFNLERGIRATSYLMHFVSESGNRPLDGNSANGLAYVLDYCANEFARQVRRNELVRRQERDRSRP